ncbi:MAG: hypothetical protein P4L84_04105 [Isosphaeraceae bacterium]|nr:hypothetical protein [Isosphaeraceae bacterium]
MPLPRFRIWTLMIAVGVVALALGGMLGVLRLRQRASAYRATASRYADLELVWRSIEERDGGGSPVDVYDGPYRTHRRTTTRAVLDQMRRLRATYECAARCPWLPVPPDPPEPK